MFNVNLGNFQSAVEAVKMVGGHRVGQDRRGEAVIVECVVLIQPVAVPTLE